MNRKNTACRTQIIRCLCEGNGIRPTARLCGCAINTVVKLLTEIGPACSDYQDRTLINLNSMVVQVDEIWAFVGAKQKHVSPEKAAEGWGDCWTWTALDADSKLMITWHIGLRTEYDARKFMHDLARRLKNRIQLTSDGFAPYRNAVRLAFGKDVDYGMLIKSYGTDPVPETRYSPALCLSARPTPIYGDPLESQISTSYVERGNLSIRMQNRRFTRLTNGHSKKLANHAYALSLYFMFYNFCRPNMAHKKAKDKTQRTPAMVAGLTDHVWTIEEMIKAVTSK